MSGLSYLVGGGVRYLHWVHPLPFTLNKSVFVFVNRSGLRSRTCPQEAHLCDLPAFSLYPAFGKILQLYCTPSSNFVSSLVEHPVYCPPFDSITASLLTIFDDAPGLEIGFKSFTVKSPQTNPMGWTTRVASIPTP